MSARLLTCREAIRLIEPGMQLGVGGSINAGHPMALVRELMRSGDGRSPPAKLSVVSSITAGLEVDFLVGAGIVEELFTAHVGAEELAPVGPAFARALGRGDVRYHDVDEGLHLTGLQAAAQRLPFGVWTASLGTSIPENNPMVTLARDPISGRYYLRVDPLAVDVSLFWAPAADRHGNVLNWRPTFGDPALAAASQLRIYQVETLLETDELLAAGPVTPAAADVIVTAPRGTHPFSSSVLRLDGEWISSYVRAVRAGEDEAAEFMRCWFGEVADEESYQHLVGPDRLAELQGRL